MVTCSSTELDNDGRPEMRRYPFSGSIRHLRRHFVPERLAYVSTMLQSRLNWINSAACDRVHQHMLVHRCERRVHGVLQISDFWRATLLLVLCFVTCVSV